MSLFKKRSDTLRKYLSFALILHVIVGFSFLIPYMIKQYKERLAREQAKLARLEKKDKEEDEAEKLKQKLAKEILIEKAQENIKELLLEHMDELEFEELWDEVMEDMQEDLQAMLDDLQEMDLEADPEALKEMMAEFNKELLDKFEQELAKKSKEMIAAELLKQIEMKIPAFVKKIEQDLKKSENQIEQEVKKLAKKSKALEEKRINRAVAKLDTAKKSIATAKKLNEEVKKAVKDHLNQEKSQAQKKAEATKSLDKALTNLKKAEGELKTAREEAKKPATQQENAKQAQQKAKQTQAQANKAQTEADKAQNKTQANKAQDQANKVQTQADKAKAQADKQSADAKATAVKADKAVNAVKKTIADTAREISKANPNAGTKDYKKSILELKRDSTDLAKKTSALKTSDNNGVQKPIDNAAKKIADAIAKLSKDLTTSKAALSASKSNSQKPTLSDAQKKRSVSELSAAANKVRQVKKQLKSAHDDLTFAANVAKHIGDKKLSEDISASKKDLQTIANDAVKTANNIFASNHKKKQALQSKGQAEKSTLEKASTEELSNADKTANKTDAALAELDRSINTQKKGMIETKKTFNQKVDDAIKKSLEKGSLAQKSTSEFIEKSMTKNFAAQLRNETENAAREGLKKQGYKPDEAFVKKMGDKAFEAMVKQGANLKKSAFSKLTGKAADALGANKGGTKSEAKSKSKTGGKAGGESGASNKSGGASSKSGIEKKVSDSLAKIAKTKLNQSMNTNKGMLKMATPGGKSAKALASVKRAQGKLGRQMSSKGGEKTLIDLSRSLSSIGATKLSKAKRVRLYRGSDVSMKKYKDTMLKMKDRGKDELVISAPPLDSKTSEALYKLSQNRIANILVEDLEEDEDKDKKEDKDNGEERTLYKSPYKTLNYGGAVLAQKAPTVDGDLSEWKDIEPFKLTGVHKKSEWGKKTIPETWKRNKYLMVQWNAKGLYFAYRMASPSDTFWAAKGQFWSNDCLEIFVDFGNKRSNKRTFDTQQFFFWPLGSLHGRKVKGGDWFGGEATTKGTKLKFKLGGTGPQALMGVKRIAKPRGYSVEIFLPVEFFKKSELRPGGIIAFNYSTHNGEKLHYRWTSNLGKNISQSPSLWGDLLLLGTDAEIAFIKPGTKKSLKTILPGEPLGIQVTDMDMNLNQKKPDKIKISVSSENGDMLEAFLEETGENTGIFAGSIDTDLMLLQGDERFKDAKLQIRGRETIRVQYLDQARQYGERNFQIESKLAVGLAILQLSAQ
ncbi:MAG: hypothetical protein HRT89_00430 [Lentisphaeria bacterium]|nr:hypothetical protein [Lentisphaeria bacterium]